MEIIFLQCKKPIGMELMKKYTGIQILNSRYIAGREHVVFSLLQAKRAFERGENITNDLLLELTVRVSAQRQIKRALELFGLPAKEVVIVGDEIPENIREYGCIETNSELTQEKYENVKRAFGIDEKEILTVSKGDYETRAKVLQEIVKERVALVNIL
jgi:KEOPS complex subunit Cgi121